MESKKKEKEWPCWKIIFFYVFIYLKLNWQAQQQDTKAIVKS